MIKVADVASFAAMRVLSDLIGRRVGGSTGTNLMGALQLAAEMKAAGRHGSIVTLICDSGDRYADTYYDDAWLAETGLEPTRYAGVLREFERSCAWPTDPPFPAAGYPDHHPLRRGRNPRSRWA